MEIFIIGALVAFVLVYNKTINSNKFIQDNQVLFEKLKEDDFEFLVAAKYGDKVDPMTIFQKR